MNIYEDIFSNPPDGCNNSDARRQWRCDVLEKSRDLCESIRNHEPLLCLDLKHGSNPYAHYVLEQMPCKIGCPKHHLAAALRKVGMPASMLPTNVLCNHSTCFMQRNVSNGHKVIGPDHNNNNPAHAHETRLEPVEIGTLNDWIHGLSFKRGTSQQPLKVQILDANGNICLKSIEFDILEWQSCFARNTQPGIYGEEYKIKGKTHQKWGSWVCFLYLVFF